MAQETVSLAGADPLRRLPGAGPAPAGSSESSFLAGLKGGHPSAYEELLRRYETKIYSLARGMTRSDEDAMDVVQETFLSVLKNIGRFKGESSLSTWIYRIAANHGLMRLRKRKRTDRVIPIDECMPTYDDTGHRVASLPDWHPRADEILLNVELRGLLREAIASLEPDYRIDFILRDQEQMSNEKVAEVLKLSVAAVKSRLHRARVFLRERVKRYVLEGR